MNNNINIEIGERIKLRRKQLNMSQSDLADKLNLKNRSTVTRYEQGDKTFKQSQIIALAEALNTTPSYLMGWEDEKETNGKHSIYDDIGNNLKQLRESRNISTEEMANEISISVEDLKKYESGLIQIPIETLEKIAKYFNVEIDDLTTVKFPTSEKTALVTKDVKLAKRQEKWFKELGFSNFTDEELDELITFAKFLISKRKDK